MTSKAKTEILPVQFIPANQSPHPVSGLCRPGTQLRVVNGLGRCTRGERGAFSEPSTRTKDTILEVLPKATTPLVARTGVESEGDRVAGRVFSVLEWR